MQPSNANAQNLEMMNKRDLKKDLIKDQRIFLIKNL